MAWKDRDEYSPWIAQKRLSLRATVDIHLKNGDIADVEAIRLKELIDIADISFFYPLVYLVDLSRVHPSRRQIAGSGAAAGSHEFLITDLNEHEFALMFAHFRDDHELRRLVHPLPGEEICMDSYQLCEFVENRSRTA